MINGLSVIQNKKWVYIIAGLYILLNAIFLYLESFYMMLLPFALFLVYLAFFSLDKLVLIIVFLVPLSIPLKEFLSSSDFNMSLPSEPLLFGVFLLFIMNLFLNNKIDKKIYRHPVSIAIYIYLIWMFITSMTSSMPIVSFKYLLARLWFLAAFYFITAQIMRKHKNIKTFLWAYMVPLIGVIIYTIIRHIEYGIFDKQVAHWVMGPFYNDHTAYAAVLTMFIPVLIGFLFKSDYSFNIKLLILPVLILFIFATLLSYSRAGWGSLVAMALVYLVILLRMKLRTLIFLGLIVLGLFFHYQSKIMMHLERNRQDSSAKLSEHIESMSNISTDASNVERINRWQCAFRMFYERPFFGWGPGTYQFKYAPFQFSYDRTIISTNAGDKGNAHSEYIGPLAESGVLGTLTFLAIVIATVATSLSVYRRLRNKETKMLVMALFLGLVTYYVHGFLNNFLDSDKASAPFWGFTAIIVAIDLYHSKQEKLSAS